MSLDREKSRYLQLRSESAHRLCDYLIEFGRIKTALASQATLQATAQAANLAAQLQEIDRKIRAERDAWHLIHVDYIQTLSACRVGTLRT